MIKRLKNVNSLVLSFLVGALLLQSVTAASNDCAMMDTSTHSMPAVEMEHHDHAGHNMSPADVEAASICCGDGMCSMLDCLSVVALPPAFVVAGMVPNAPNKAALKPPIPHFSPSTLFKPPITS